MFGLWLMMQNNQNKGTGGEDLAVACLISKGFSILERNWRFRHWEVDIIAAKGKFLHFVEVKTRHSLRYGYPEESITRQKMSNLKSAADEYQHRHPEWKFVQFDVLAITVIRGEAAEVLVIEDVYF